MAGLERARVGFSQRRHCLLQARISSNRLLDLLGVDADPVLRQRVAKRQPPLLSD
jgi:hypothetical protein